MQLQHQIHRLHFFANFTDVEANAQVIDAISEALPKTKWIPSSGREFNSATTEQRDFLILEGEYEGVRVRMEFAALEFVLTGAMCNAVDFKDVAFEIVNGLSTLFKLKTAHRVSAVSTYVHTGDVSEYNDLYRQLFTYRTIEPFEWDNRIAERLDTHSGETINSISTIKRAEIAAVFLNEGRSTEAIVVELDSNTTPKNQKNRFHFDSNEAIYAELFDNNKRMLDSLQRYF